MSILTSTSSLWKTYKHQNFSWTWSWNQVILSWDKILMLTILQNHQKHATCVYILKIKQFQDVVETVRGSRIKAIHTLLEQTAKWPWRNITNVDNTYEHICDIPSYFIHHMTIHTSEETDNPTAAQHTTTKNELIRIVKQRLVVGGWVGDILIHR